MTLSLQIWLNHNLSVDLPLKINRFVLLFYLAVKKITSHSEHACFWHGVVTWFYWPYGGIMKYIIASPSKTCRRSELQQDVLRIYLASIQSHSSVVPESQVYLSTYRLTRLYHDLQDASVEYVPIIWTLGIILCIYICFMLCTLKLRSLWGFVSLSWNRTLKCIIMGKCPRSICSTMAKRVQVIGSMI